nr:DUF1127 domain-containing protein [Sinorhizobium fredii]
MNETTIPDQPCRSVQRKEHPMYLTFVLSKIRAHQRYRRTLRAFTQLNDHLLEDVGITRNEIDVVARRQYDQ